MRRVLTIIFAISANLVVGFALSHPETERYIPIGESPGISNSQSYIGKIETVDTQTHGFTMQVKGRMKNLRITGASKIFLDRSSQGKPNLIGIYSDCKPGRLVEVYRDAAGEILWIKVKMP